VRSLVGRQLRLRRVAEPGFLAAVAGPLLVGLISLWAIVPTLGPTVASWDTAEFQTVGPVMGTAHPTGYPSYVILGWFAGVIFQPFGDPAFRMNLLQAFLAALAAGATTALVGILTGRRFVAFAVGLGLLAMPFVSDVSVTLPVAGTITTTPVFMRLATHADPHMFHAALVPIIFGLLAMWDRRLHELPVEERGKADRWLVAAAFAYAVAVANHSLALLLPPGIALFVLMADWRIILRWRSILACVGVLVGALVLFFAELPIRAAMHAPLVYGHPDTLSGFQYVILAEQFRGSLVDPLGNLGDKASAIVSLMTGWLGPLLYLGILGIGTSLIKRPRFVVLSGLTFLLTCFFSVAYANADIERYFLVPVLIGYVWIGLGAADLLAAVAEAVAWALDRFAPAGVGSVAEASAGDRPEAGETGRGSVMAVGRGAPGGARGRFAFVLLGLEFVVAAALILPVPGTIPTRQEPDGFLASGGVSEAGQTDAADQMRAILAPAGKGGLPENSVIVSWWSVSTTLWYGQRVLGLRPDIYIVDDRTRLDDNLGSVQDVFNRFLGNRPVFAIRLDGGSDGMQALSTEYEMRPFTLGDAEQINQVIGRKGNQ